MSVTISIRVTVPKSILDQNAVVSELKRVLRSKTGPDIKHLFEGATSTWDPPPLFSIADINRADAIGVTVSSSDRRIGYVNFGTPPHVIRPKTGGMLRFQTGYRAKSRPGSLKSSTGGKFGPYTSQPFVHHPGSEARAFDQAVQDEYRGTFERDIQDSINSAAVIP